MNNTAKPVFYKYIYALIGDMRTLVFCSQWDLLSELYLVIHMFFIYTVYAWWQQVGALITNFMH